MTTPKILIIPGSHREGSVNAKLGHIMAKAIDDAGGKAELLSLADFPMPIYNGDLEQKSGPPEQALALAEKISSAHGVVLINPEYNGSFTPLLKNTVDWLSRDMGDFKPYKGRVFALASASPGALGGIRGLSHVRDSLVSIGAEEIITPQLCVGPWGNVVDDNGNITTDRHQTILQNVVTTLINRAKTYA